MTEELALSSFLEKPEDFESYLKRTKDFEKGFEIVNYIHSMVKGADSILDIVIKAMESEWFPHEHDGERFYNAMVRKTQLSAVTIQRHTRVGEMLQKVPAEYRPQIEAKDVKSKVAMTDAVLSGLPFEDEQWKRVADAWNYQEVAEVVREVKGNNPRKQWMKFAVDENDIIWVSTNEGRFEFARVNHDPDIADIIEKAKKKFFAKASILPRITY